MNTEQSGPVGSDSSEGLGGERTAFEAAIERELNYGFDFKQDPSGNYLHDATDTAWTAWQARAALAAAPVQAVPNPWTDVQIDELAKKHFNGANRKLRALVRAIESRFLDPSAAPQPAEREPLTDGQIDLLTEHIYLAGRPVSKTYRVALARALGIKPLNAL